MANKLLVVCPTRQRPEQCKQMYESINTTSLNANFLFCIDDDDPKLFDYIKMFNFPVQINKKLIVIRMRGKRESTTFLFNQSFKSFPDYEFYCLMNDDVIFKTPGWDETLCQKGKICYGNDLCARDAMPTFPVIDGDIVRAVGWLQLPTLTYMYGDAVWKMIGNRLGILKYFPNVIIEHNHWMIHKSEIDDVYKKTNSAETYKRDEEAYRFWKNNTLEADLQKIRGRLVL